MSAPTKRHLMQKYTSRLEQFSWVWRLAAALMVFWLAWSVRDYAAIRLPVDFDEDDYMRAAQEFTAVFRSGDLAGLTQFNYRPEHPPLPKIAYGIRLLGVDAFPLIEDKPTSADPDKTIPLRPLIHTRRLGAGLGALTAGLLALVSPLAGLFLALNAMTAKYNSQVMLEALPALSSLLMALTYLYGKKRGSPAAWLGLSAVFLGITAASKYMYCVVGLTILLDWALDARAGSASWRAALRFWLPRAFAWGMLGVVVFFLLDPYLWPDPLTRLHESVFYHASYSTTSTDVQRANYPIWQQFIHLTTSAAWWHEGIFPVPIEPVIFVLACFGLVRQWRRERLYVLWLALGMGFLLVWPTKWPQYTLLLTAPLSLVAVEGFQALIVAPLQRWWQNRSAEKAAPELNQWKQAWPWLVPGLLAFFVFTVLPLLFQFAISLTDFSANSIRDGFQGGVFREVFGGLTGQIQPTPFVFPARETQVQFIGWNAYMPTLRLLSFFGQPFMSLLWTVLSLIIQTLLGLGVALLLAQRGLKFRRAWELLFILPWAIPEMIGALMWLNIFIPDVGWLPLAIKGYGQAHPLAFLLNWPRDSQIQLLVLLIAAAWYGFPFLFLASSAGLKLIPTEIYDASAMDGANEWQTFRHITWPLLLPLVLPAILVRGIFSFNQFYLFQTFRSPDFTLSVFSYNVFNPIPQYFDLPGGQFATSAVINIFAMLCLMGLVAIFNRWSKAGEGVTYA